MFYVNTDSIIAISVIFPSLAIIVVALRFWLKTHRFCTREASTRHPTGLWIDDWLSLIALALVIVTAVLYIYGAARKVVGGYLSNKGVNTLTTYNPIEGLQVTLHWIVVILNASTTGCIRLSILFYYKRIFRGRTFSIVNWSTIGVAMAWIICFTIAPLAICDSLLVESLKRAPIVQFKNCHNPSGLIAAASAIAVTLDIVVLATPLFCIWNLHMKWAQKVWVSSVFSIGILSVAAGVMRMLAAWDLMLRPGSYHKIDKRFVLRDESNWLGAVSTYMFWEFIEVGTGMIVCCLLPLKPILKPVVFRAFIRSLRRRLGLPCPRAITPGNNYEGGDFDSRTITKQITNNHVRSVSSDVGFEELMLEAIRKGSLGTELQSNCSS